ncbi:MAG: hypothetical protein RI538_05315 [Salibaculum sp.]|uniref:hypothetical protein n=1 Tax=Salibaculum sp. TaxID=2855480 RepID=UPI0028702066|nr:hypothetical protein [Salibaculum sp.]MDR9427904.1 hypothetical protein [Salibaculum sp.]MDR9482186.1 hypothetical protein [Salibaculum sp.]
MIDRDDLRAAVSAGIVTERQAAAIASLADSRRGAREGLSSGDEPFELFKGFNEIFIVIGLVILAAGWVGMNAVTMATEVVNYRTQVITMAGVAAVVLWLLSEYFIRRRRMVAPAIALSVLFAGNAAAGFIAGFAQPFMVAQQDFSSLPWPFVLTTLALAVFWLRFRVPFAMAMIAVGLFVVAMLLAATSAGSPDSVEDLFLLSAGGPFAWITLVLGLLVFIAAMWFDMSDPHRVTRRSANGFWLHLVAAPALVNTLALSLLEQEGSTLLLLIVLAFFALVAIVIDRRSFLIAAIGYVVTLSFTVLGEDSTATTTVALGAVLLLLGAFWEAIRARLLRLMPFLPLDRLPPST